MPGVEAAYDILENLNKLFARNAENSFDLTNDVNDDPSYIREVLRPAVIKEDVRLMEQRKRVSLILKSAAFRRHLDSIISDQLEVAANPPELHPGQTKPHHKYMRASAPLVSQGMSHRKNLTAAGLWPVAPINDLSGVATSGTVPKLPEVERQARCDLAALARMLHLFNWAPITNTSTNISLRVRRSEEFLINPKAQFFNELSASRLIKFSLVGNLSDQENHLQVDLTEADLHADIYKSNSGIRTILHINTPSIIAVASTESLLLPLSREAILVGAISRKVSSNSGLKEDCLLALSSAVPGQSSSARLLFLPGAGGLLVCAGSVEEAWFLTSCCLQAAQSQLSVSGLKPEDLWLPEPGEVARLRHAYLQQATQGLGEACTLGELEWEAMMRHLDNAGFRTGHYYRRAHVAASLGLDEAAASSTSVAGSGYSGSTGRPGRTEVEIPACTLSRELMEAQAAAATAAAATTTSMDSQQVPGTPRGGTLTSPAPHWMTSPHQYARFDQYYESSGPDGEDDDDRSKLPYGRYDQSADEEASSSFLRRALDEDGVDEAGGVMSEGGGVGGSQSAASARKRAAQRRKVRSARWVALGGGGGGGVNKSATGPFRSQATATLPPVSATAARDQPNQFAPQGRNAKEFRQRQRLLKKKYFEDETTAGPSSQRLEGFTWEELMFLKQRGMAKMSADGKRLILLAATSQAVIEKDARNFTPLLHSDFLASTNPFEKVTDADLENYRREIEIRNNPELARLIQEQKQFEEKEAQLRERERQQRQQVKAQRRSAGGQQEAEVRIVTPQAASSPQAAAAVVVSGDEAPTAEDSLDTSRVVRSDTSTYEDTEREGTDTGADVTGSSRAAAGTSSPGAADSTLDGEKKKKRRFKMPFGRKKKDGIDSK